MHGGASTGNPSAHGNKSAVKHGIYSTALLPGEEAIVAEVSSELGRLENELLITRLRLRRALAAEAKSIKTDDYLVIESQTERDGGGAAYAAAERTLKRVDYSAIIDRLMARIESLEKARLELIAEGQGGEAATGWTFTVRRAKKDA